MTHVIQLAPGQGVLQFCLGKKIAMDSYQTHVQIIDFSGVFMRILTDFHGSGDIPMAHFVESAHPRKEGDRTIKVEPEMQGLKWGELSKADFCGKKLQMSVIGPCWVLTLSPGAPWHRSRFARRKRYGYPSGLPLPATELWLPFATR